MRLFILLCELTRAGCSAEPPRDTTALLLQRGGPEVIIVEYNVTTGRPTGLRKIIKRQWPALSGFTVDSQEQRAHFFTSAPQVALYSFAFATSSLLELQSTDGNGLRLRDAANASVSHIWNVAPWESRGSLLAVAPSASCGFNTSVLAVNTTSGVVEVLNEVRGSPVQGMYAMDSMAGRYFFIVTQVHQRMLVVYHVGVGIYELVGLGRDVSDLAGMHYDREGCQLVVMFARPNGVLEMFAVDLPGQGQGLAGEAKLTHLATMASASGQTHESFQYIGLTALLTVGSRLSILIREPNKLQLAIHHLQEKSKTPVDIASHDIVGMAIRIQRTPTVTSLAPSHIGIWGQSRGVIAGFDFGVRDPSPHVVVGNTVASSVAWISDSAISFQAPALPARISDPWFRADGFVYRINWGAFAGEVQSQQREKIIACHPRYAEDKVCAYAGTAREMRCMTLSVGFVCARYDSGWDETISLDVQVGVYGSWLESDVSTDVVATWVSVKPSVARVDGGQLVTISGGPFSQNKGAFSCRFGRQIQGVASYFNQSIVTCKVPRWPLTPGVTQIDILQTGSAMPTDSSAIFLFIPGVPARLVLEAAPAEVVAEVQSQVFELQLHDQDANHVVEHVANISVQIVPLVLAQANAAALPNHIEGASRETMVSGHATFVFTIQRAGTYLVRFTTESCQSSASSESDVCLAVNATLKVSVAVQSKTITVSAPSHALAGLPIFPEPEIRVLDSEGRISNVSEQVVARLVGAFDRRAFTVTNTSTLGGSVHFTDLTIFPNGTHTILFTLMGELSQIQIQHNITILHSEPRQLYNAGSRPFDTHPAMLPLSPSPSIGVLDVAGNRIVSRYWTQTSNGSLVPNYLNVVIRAQLSRDVSASPPGSIPLEGRLFGAVDVLLQGQPAFAGQCLSAMCSGHGSCNTTAAQLSPVCSCDGGWQGSLCSLPNQSHLCGGGDVCGADLGYWDDVNRTCVCLDAISMLYSVTQRQRQSADFDELFIDTQAKGYAMTFSAHGLTTAHSFLFAIAAGAGSRLHVTSHPEWAAAGAGLASSPVVTVKDAGQNVVVAGAPIVTVSLQDAPTLANITGTLVRKVYRGGVTFTDLIINRPTRGFPLRLKFSSESGGLLPAYTDTFEVAEGPPSNLILVQEPDAASGGTPLRLQPKLAVVDPAANLVSRAQGTVDVRLQGPEMLLGNTQVPLINGEAQFTDLTINLNATGYVMIFSAKLQSVDMPPGILGHRWYGEVNMSQISESFQVMAGRVVRMLLFRQPGEAYGGEMVPQPIIHFVDSGGNLVAGDLMMVSVAARRMQRAEVILADALLADEHLGFYASDTGSIEFTDLELLHPWQRFQLVFSINETASEQWAGREPNVISATLDNAYGALSNLSIAVQPGNVAAGGYFARTVKIVLMDRGGNLVPKSGVRVSVSIDMAAVTLTYASFNSSLSPDGSPQLKCQGVELGEVQGTSSISTTQGVALFSDLRVGTAGSGFKLVFESELLARAVSQPFGVTLGQVAVSLHVVCNPGNEVAGVVFAYQPILDVVDRGGNRMHAQMPDSIVARLISPSSDVAIMTGVLNASMHADLATFTNLAIDLADNGYVIEFYAEGLAATTTFPFTVIPGAAVALHFQGPMPQPVPSEAFQVSITSRDRGGNLNSSSSSPLFNVTATLFFVESVSRVVTCRGAHECLSMIDLSVPAGSHLLSANMSITATCTDFDSPLEQLTSVMLGSYSLKQFSEYNAGPFAGCFRNCSKSAQVTEGYDIVQQICLDGGRSEQQVCRRLPLLMEFDRETSTKWDLIQALHQFDTSTAPLRVHTSAEVNFNPCNGYLLDATVEVLLTFTMPEDEAVLNGNPKALSQNGLAVFTDLAIDVMQTDFVLAFSSGSDPTDLLAAYSEPFRLTYGPVRQLIMLSQPEYGTGNRTLQPAPVLMLADAAKNRVDATGLLVQAQLFHGMNASQLKGLTTVASKSGLVQFTDLFVGIKSDGINYTILFSLVHEDIVPACNSSLSICTVSFAIYEGPACCMRIIVRPRTAAGGVPFGAQPLLKSFDWGGNAIALSNAQVSAKIVENGGVTGKVLRGLALFTNGSAQFENLAIDKAGLNYTMVFTSPKMISVTSLPFDIHVGNASIIVVVRQIGGARVDKLFLTQPAVAVVDAGGNTVQGWDRDVLVSIYQQGTAIHSALHMHSAVHTDGNATLTGNTTGKMYRGVSYFWNLRLDRMGLNFQLRFSAVGLTGGVSAPFDVFGSNATQLVILLSPPLFTNMLLNPTIVVAALDDVGNVDGFTERSFLFSVLEGVMGAPPLLIQAPAVVFSKGILSVAGIQMMGMVEQSRWQITETTHSHMSIVSVPFDMIDALTGWWAVSARTSTLKLFMEHNENTLQVSANVENLNHTMQGTRQPNLYSKYGSMYNDKDGCIQTSLLAASSLLSGVHQSNANLLGLHLRSCQEGLLQGTIASKVGMTANVDASWARDIVYIEIQEYEPVKQMQRFIVIANSKNSSSSTSDTVVYRWNGLGLDLYQRFADTKGAYDVEHFVYGGLHYILVANHFDGDGAGYGAPSMLYQYIWSRAKKRNIFKPIQAISTEGAVSWKFLEIEQRQFLVAANYFNGSHSAINSSVYRLQRHDPDSTVPRLTSFQSIPTNGARDVVHISDKDKHLIAFANRFEMSVQVMQWSYESQRFLPAAPLPCAQALDLEVFSSGGVSYVVCMSLTNIQLASGKIPTNGSAVFKFNSSTNGFVRVQQLPTTTGKYMSVFTSGQEILLAVANVELIGANAVPLNLQEMHAGTTDIFSWDGTRFIPFLNLPIRQGYANMILDIPCRGLSVDGSLCASRTSERLVLVAQGEDNGIQTIALDTVNATRHATHLKILPVTRESTSVNSTIVPVLMGTVMNFDVIASLSWIQETISVDSLKWTNPVTGILNVPTSVLAHGVTESVVNASGVAVFPNIVVVAAGIVSIRMSNMYLNPVRMANTAQFHVTAGAPAKLSVFSASPRVLISGDTLSAIVIVGDVFGNHQPILSSPLTITAFSYNTSKLSLVNNSVTTSDGIARFGMAVSGNSRDAVITFRAAGLHCNLAECTTACNIECVILNDEACMLRCRDNLHAAFTPPLVVKRISSVLSIESDQVMIGSAAVPIGNNQVVFIGGRNRTVASNRFIMADVSSLPYLFVQPTFLGMLPAARYDHDAVGGVFLNSHKTLLVIGGTNGSRTFNDVHAFDLVTSTWTDLKLSIDSSGRSGHRAQLAKLTFEDAGTSSKRSVVAVLGGQDSTGATAGGVVILGLLSRSIRVEKVMVDNVNPFTAQVLGCCAFMFKWHGGHGYVFGKDSSGVGRLYSLTILFRSLQNEFEMTWIREYPDAGEPLVFPRAALSKSSFELGGQLFFPATQMTTNDDAVVYALDVSTGQLKWLEVDVGGFYLDKDSMYSTVDVAVGKALLIPTTETLRGQLSTRRMLAMNNMALVLSVVTAERLLSVSNVPRGTLSGVRLSPQPVVFIDNAHGKRARDESGYARVTVAAYDADTKLPIGLRGQQVLEADDGVASFVDLNVINSAKRVMLTFSSPSLFPASWGPFEVTTGPGAYAVFAVELYGAQPGKVFAIQPTVKLTDAAGNDVTTDSTTLVSVGLQKEVGTLFQDAVQYLTGNAVAVVRNGVVAFTDLGMTNHTPTDINLRLTVLAAGMSSSVGISFHLARPSETQLHLNWTTHTNVCTNSPSANHPACNVYKRQAMEKNVLIAGMITQQPVRIIITLNSTYTRYDYDDYVPIRPKPLLNLTLVRADNLSAASVGAMTALSKEAVAGEADFFGLQVNLVGKFRLKAASFGFPEVFSEVFEVVSGVPHSMEVMNDVSQSLNVYPSAIVFSTQPMIYVVDAEGNAVDVVTSVSVSVQPLTPLLGNPMAVTRGGIATFTDLALGLDGMYSLVFTASDLCCGNQLNATSRPFNITVGAPYQMVEDRAPADAVGSEQFPQQPVIHILDAGGNHVLTDSSTLVKAWLEKDESLQAYALQTMIAPGKTVASMEHFAANGTDYILVALNFDTEIQSYHLESILYEWDGSQEVMVEVQRIITEGATACTHVEYENQHYVFITNGYKELEIVGDEMIGTYLTESELHRLSGGRLEKISTFGTQGPTNVVTFMANGQMHVLVANSYDGVSSLIESDVYVFSPWSATKLSLVQELLLDSAKVLHSFYSRSQLYVFVGSNFNTTSKDYVCDSQFYRFENGLLKPWQSMRTSGIIGVQSFDVSADHSFFVVANSVSIQDTSDGGFVAIHSFSNGRLQETAEQEIGPILGITHIRHFTMNATEYLTVSSNPTDGKDGYLGIYVWDSSNCSMACTPNFVLSQNLTVDEAERMVFFKDVTDSAFMVFGGASGLQGIAFRTRTIMTGAPVRALKGVASFTDLGINLAQTNYRLRYEASGMLSLLGASFKVAPGEPFALSLLSEAGHALGGQAFATQARVGLVDKGGNMVLSAEGSVVFITLAAWQISTMVPHLRGNVEARTSQGVATFTDLGIDRVGWSVLQFNCSTNSSTNSLPLKHATQLITVNAGSAHGLVVLQSAALALGGLPFHTQPKLALIDAGGNSITANSARTSSPIRVGVSISSEVGTVVSALVHSTVAATMVSSPSNDVVFASLKGEAQLVMAVSENEVAVYEWGCQGPNVMQTFAAGHVTDFEMLRVDGVMWLFVAATQPAVLKMFARSQITEEFVLKYEVPLQGLTAVQCMLLGGKPFVLASGSIRNGNHLLESNYSTLYALEINNVSSVTAFESVQEIRVGQLVDSEAFHYEHQDFLLLQNASHLSLHVWNSHMRVFAESELILFDARKVTVTCCSNSGHPIISLASLTRPSVLTVMQGTQPSQIGLALIHNSTANALVSTVMADQVVYIWRGSTLYTCWTSASKRWLFRAEKLTLGVLPLESVSLPQGYTASATRSHQAVAFISAHGLTYLLLTGRDEQSVVLHIGGPGALAGSTIVVAAQGVVEFTDLALDLIGNYTLSFAVLSLDVQHESYESYVSAGAAMKISVALGEARSLALVTLPFKGQFPTVTVVDDGGNPLGADVVDTLDLRVVAQRDQPEVLTDFRLISSNQFGYPAHVHHFDVNGTHYIAIADSYDGSSYTTMSQIMKLVQGVDGESLLSVSALLTKCAYRFSSFRMKSYNVTRTPMTRTDYYLAVANHFDDTAIDLTYATHSVIYKMDPIRETFELMQAIPTVGATKLEPFRMHGVQYVAIANFFDGSFHSVDSQIWKWDHVMGNFSWMQNIATVGAHDIEHIQSGTDHFLLVAQYRSANEVDYASSSLLLQYSEMTGNFELLTSVASGGARDVEVFAIQGVNYFAVANYINLADGSKETQSQLYKLECMAADGTSGPGSANTYVVRVHQTFASTGGSSWTHFERGGHDFLALTSLDGSEEDAIMIFDWNGTAFDVYTNVTTNGQTVIAGAFFTAPGGYYSVMALPQSSSVNLYKFVSANGAVPAISAPQQAVAGQFTFNSFSYTDGEYYDFNTEPEGVLDPVASGAGLSSRRCGLVKFCFSITSFESRTFIEN